MKDVSLNVFFGEIVALLVSQGMNVFPQFILRLNFLDAYSAGFGARFKNPRGSNILSILGYLAIVENTHKIRHLNTAISRLYPHG